MVTLGPIMLMIISTQLAPVSSFSTNWNWYCGNYEGITIACHYDYNSTTTYHYMCCYNRNYAVCGTCQNNFPEMRCRDECQGYNVGYSSMSYNTVNKQRKLCCPFVSATPPNYNRTSTQWILPPTTSSYRQTYTSQSYTSETTTTQSYLRPEFKGKNNEKSKDINNGVRVLLAAVLSPIAVTILITVIAAVVYRKYIRKNPTNPSTIDSDTASSQNERNIAAQQNRNLVMRGRSGDLAPSVTTSPPLYISVVGTAPCTTPPQHQTLQNTGYTTREEWRSDSHHTAVAPPSYDQWLQSVSKTKRRPITAV